MHPVECKFNKYFIFVETQEVSVGSDYYLECQEKRRAKKNNESEIILFFVQELRTILLCYFEIFFFSFVASLY